jgi:hypothetical protein
MRRVIIAGVIILLTLLLLYPLSHAQEHRHGDEVISGEVGRFYDRWRQPANRSVSCCSRYDCYATEAYMRGGTWFFKHRESGRFLPVPASAIETEADSPSPENHVCANKSGSLVFCFLPSSAS